MESIIESVQLKVFRSRSRVFRDAANHLRVGEERDVVLGLLVITDHEGACGYCIVEPDQLRDRILSGFVRPVLVGRDSQDREALWHALARAQRGSGGSFTDRALGYVDQALWDLLGRRLDTPVWRLLGGARPRVRAYASTMCGDEEGGGLGSPQEYADFARHLVDVGYRAIKLHTWIPELTDGPDRERDARACEAVRDAVGPGIELMLDPYHWFSRVEALWLGRCIEELDFTWYEEPMEEASLQSYRWLSDQLAIPVLGPESSWGKGFTRAEWVLAGASDILRAGVNDCGGITPVVKICHLAESVGMDCEIHNGGAANLAAIGGTHVGRFYERGLVHPDHDYDAVPPHLNSLIDALDPDGFVAMCPRPGLGEDLNFDFIAANELEVV